MISNSSLKSDNSDEVKAVVPRELTKAEKNFIEEVPQKVYGILTAEASRHAIARIDRYLQQHPNASKETFFKELKDEIKRSLSLEGAEKIEVSAFAGVERLAKLLASITPEKLFKKSSLFGPSNAAKCLFDLCRIYSLYPVLDQASDEIIGKDPYFQKMLKKSVSIFQYFIREEKHTIVIQKRCQELVKKQLLASKESKDLNINLLTIIKTAQQETYWQPDLFFRSKYFESKQLILQQQLVSACEEGDSKKVKSLFSSSQKIRPKVDLADPSGKFPFAAAVWGMNTEIVDFLLEQAKQKNEKIMPWEACEMHNISRYGSVFLLPEQFSTMTEPFLYALETSPYLQNLFLKAIKFAGKWEEFREASVRRRHADEATIGRNIQGAQLPSSLIATYKTFKEDIQEKVVAASAPNVSLIC